MIEAAAINGGARRAGSEDVEEKHVGELFTRAVGEINDLADNWMIAKLDALDDLAVANIKAGDYATRGNDPSSSGLIFPSSKARPVIAALAPRSSSSRRSSAFLTPPEACRLIVG